MVVDDEEAMDTSEGMEDRPVEPMDIGTVEVIFVSIVEPVIYDP